MICPHCSSRIPQQANFCPHCGCPVTRFEDENTLETQTAKARFDIFLLSVLGSLVLTLILTLVFNLPIFILGAFLPLFGFGLRRRRS